MSDIDINQHEPIHEPVHESLQKPIEKKKRSPAQMEALHNARQLAYAKRKEMLDITKKTKEIKKLEFAKKKDEIENKLIKLKSNVTETESKTQDASIIDELIHKIDYLVSCKLQKEILKKELNKPPVAPAPAPVQAPAPAPALAPKLRSNFYRGFD